MPPVFSGFGGSIASQFSGGASGQSGQNGGLGGSGAGGSGANGSGDGNAIYGWCVGGVSGDLPEPTPCCSETYTPANPVNCLWGESEVSLGDGSHRKLCEIVKGDVISGIDCSGQIANQTVLNVAHFEAECLKVSFGDYEVVCSKGHNFIGAGIVEMPAFTLKQGDAVLSITGQNAEVVSIEDVGIMPVVAIEVSPHHMFIADGVAHHNKTACALRIDY